MLDWADAEFSNLRAGFRWATDEGRLETAVAIAAHATMLGYTLLRCEPVEWVEELLPSATAADLPQLPRLYTAASVCAHLGRPDEAVVYARTATELESDDRYRPFDQFWSRTFEALAHLNAGRVDDWLEINAALANESGISQIVGLCGLTWMLPASGQAAKAREIADAALAAARAHGTPFFVAYALAGNGAAFTETDPGRALDALREGLAVCRRHRLRFLEVAIARDTAALEAAHGNLELGLDMFDDAIDTNCYAGDLGAVATTLAQLAMFLDRYDQPDVAAALYGATTEYPATKMIAGLGEFVDRLRADLGESRFDECVAAGSTMDLAGAVQYARHHMQLARLPLTDRS